MVLAELSRTPVRVPVLHWWTGTAEETRQAVRLGCYFSIHSPAAIPCRVCWVEHLAAQQFRMEAGALRRLAWRNLGDIVEAAGVGRMLPEGVAQILSAVRTG